MDKGPVQQSGFTEFGFGFRRYTQTQPPQIGLRVPTFEQPGREGRSGRETGRTRRRAYSSARRSPCLRRPLMPNHGNDRCAYDVVHAVCGFCRGLRLLLRLGPFRAVNALATLEGCSTRAVSTPSRIVSRTPGPFSVILGCLSILIAPLPFVPNSTPGPVLLCPLSYPGALRIAAYPST